MIIKVEMSIYIDERNYNNSNILDEVLEDIVQNIELPSSESEISGKVLYININGGEIEGIKK